MSRHFIGGKNTQPEIDALSKAFEIKAGFSIKHDDVANAANVQIDSIRFKSVTNRWRKIIERGTSIRVESRDRVFHFLTADEAHDRGKSDMHRIGKATGKLHVRVTAIDAQRLTGERKDEHFILSRETAALLDSARRSAKAIQAPKPVKANLRIAN